LAHVLNQQEGSVPSGPPQGEGSERGRERDEKVSRMEFLLALRRRGIGDQAVLRAMDEIPR